MPPDDDVDFGVSSDELAALGFRATVRVVHRLRWAADFGRRKTGRLERCASSTNILIDGSRRAVPMNDSGGPETRRMRPDFEDCLHGCISFLDRSACQTGRLWSGKRSAMPQPHMGWISLGGQKGVLQQSHASEGASERQRAARRGDRRFFESYQNSGVGYSRVWGAISSACVVLLWRV